MWKHAFRDVLSFQKNSLIKKSVEQSKNKECKKSYHKKVSYESFSSMWYPDNSSPPPPPPEENCPRLGLGFGSRLGSDLGLGGNQKIVPEQNRSLVGVRVWVRVCFEVGGQFSSAEIVLEPYKGSGIANDSFILELSISIFSTALLLWRKYGLLSKHLFQRKRQYGDWKIFIVTTNF